MTTIKTITAATLQELMHDWPDTLVINVLDENTYNDCHIAGSVNFPFNQLHERLKDYDRARDVIVYCASSECPVSKKAYALLHDMGFVSVKAYEGGTKEWKQKGFATKGVCKMGYLK